MSVHVCLSVCERACMSVSLSVRYVHACVRACLCERACLSVGYVRVYVHACLSVCLCVRACVPASLLVCLSVCHLST